MMPSMYLDCNNFHVIKYKNKDEWKANRDKYIGGSEASALIGRNKYKTNQQLWKEKKD